MKNRSHAFYTEQIKLSFYDWIKLLMGKVVTNYTGPEITMYQWTRTECGACLDNNKWYRRWLK